MQRAIKRFADLLLVTIALVLLAPILASVAIAVLLFLGRPILFSQVRPGLRGRPFTMYKFRTMLCLTDRFGNPLDDGARLTRFGKFLRGTSLDELPELFNIIAGHMSLVGPRPLLMEYLERYTPEQARRHDVRPGLTGWAQVNGRNSLSWEEKFALDVWYVDRWSLAMDVKIIWMTFGKVLRREGINAASQATMPVFMGTRPPHDRGQS